MWGYNHHLQQGTTFIIYLLYDLILFANWVASSTPDGDGDLMLEQFESIMNHVMGIHDHDNPLFPRCDHGVLEDRIWLKAGNIACGIIKGIMYLHQRQ